MTSLNVSDSNIGQCVQDPELMKLHGVTHGKSKSGKMFYWSKDDKNLGEECPAHCCSPMGAIAIANAIPDIRALTSLDISKQADKYGNYGLRAEGAKCLAEALKDHP
jgi:hypothetical protein